MKTLKDKHKGETLTIVGKGPSLRYLRHEHFIDGPVIVLNSAIVPVENLDLPNVIYSQQKDSGPHVKVKNDGEGPHSPTCERTCEDICGGKIKPESAILLVDVNESACCFPGYTPRFEFNIGELGLRMNLSSFFVALQIGKHFGCDKYRLISCDAIKGDDFRAYNPLDMTIKKHDRYYEQNKIAQGHFLSELDYEFIMPQPDDPKVSIIIPVVRPESAKRCRAAIRKNAGVNRESYQIVMGEDIDKIGCPAMVKHLMWRTEHDLVMFLGDDTIPQPGFLKAALDEMTKLPDGWGVVGLNTEDPSGTNPVAHWLAHKTMLEHIPGGDFFASEYHHCWCDNEIRDIATELGRWAFAEKSLIEHRHPVNKSAETDEYYKQAYDDGKHEADKKTYTIRKRERMRAKHGTRLALAFPLTDIWTYSQFTFSILSVVMNHLTLSVKNNESIHLTILMPNFPGQVDAVRNDLVAQAQLDGCTDILMMDTDQMYPDAGMIQKLLAHKLPVVGAKVHRRYPPFDPILLRGDIGKMKLISDDEIVSGGLIQVDATGCGCILYDMAVFDDIPTPWFEQTVGEDGNPIGEDIGFCMKLKERGIDIMVDCSIDVKHLALMAVDWSTHKLHKKLQEVRQNGK